MEPVGAAPFTGRRRRRNRLAAAAIVAALSPAWLSLVAVGVLAAFGEPAAWTWLPLGIAVTALPGGLLALILGAAAARRSAPAGEEASGRRLARVALVIGGVLIVALIVLLILLFSTDCIDPGLCPPG